MKTPDHQDEHKQTIANIVKDTRVCMMAYESHESKNLHACPMTAQELQADGSIYFLGSKSSDIVQSIRKNPNVNVSFANPSAQDFVSFNGIADLVTDEAKVDELWSEFYNAFYKEGRDDPEIQLIHFRGNGAEYWKGDNKFVALFKLAKAALGSESDDNLGKSREVHYDAA